MITRERERVRSRVATSSLLLDLLKGRKGERVCEEQGGHFFITVRLMSGDRGHRERKRDCEEPPPHYKFSSSGEVATLLLTHSRSPTSSLLLDLSKECERDSMRSRQGGHLHITTRLTQRERERERERKRMNSALLRRSWSRLLLV